MISFTYIGEIFFHGLFCNTKVAGLGKFFTYMVFQSECGKVLLRTVIQAVRSRIYAVLRGQNNVWTSVNFYAY